VKEEMTLEELAERMSGDSSAPYYIAGVLREAIYRGILPEGKPLHQAQLALRGWCHFMDTGEPWSRSSRLKRPGNCMKWSVPWRRAC